MKKPARKPPGRKTQRDPTALTEHQLAFVEAYTHNGGNATGAYREISAGKPGTNTCAVEGHRLLRLPKIAAAIAQRRAERFKQLEMKGDEAIALLSLSARADILDAFDAEGKQLPVHKWPDRLRLAVKAIKDDGSIVLHDQLKARELMAVATGRLRNKVDVLHGFDHLDLLAGTETPPHRDE